MDGTFRRVLDEKIYLNTFLRLSLSLSLGELFIVT
jgi:hypothetical protein